MSDLFAPLRSPATEQPPTRPAEVRRLGDRARRRRTTLQAAGAAAAVAAIASGVLLLGPGPAAEPQPAPSAPTTPQPSQQSEPTAVPAPTRVPADFPLERGLVEGDVENSDPWHADIEYCDTGTSMADLAVDDRFAQSRVPGLNQFRSLELFAGVAQARARALDHVQKFRSCPEHTTPTGTVARTEVTENGLGD